MNELKPCPACGGYVLIGGGDEWYNKNRFFIECKNPECGCCRVGDTLREKCIERWNALPRALVWSSAPPKLSGYYWCRYKSEDKEAWSVACVPAVTDWCGLDDENDRIEWTGPIPEPQEPAS